MESYNNVSLEELTRMASKKDADAQAELSRRYSEGDSVDKNIKTAIDWAEKAYSRGRTDLAAELGNLCIKCADDSEEYAVKAIKYYMAGAEENNAECLYKLALFYNNGQYNLPKDDNKAFELLSKAIANGIGSEEELIYAQYLMANAYFKGMGTKSDIAQAMSQYIELAQKGYEPSYIKLAECSLATERVSEAEFYAKKACDSNDEQISAQGKALYAQCIEMRSDYVVIQSANIDGIIGENDKAMGERLRALQDATEKFSGFEKEANRLIHNAETLARIGNYNRVPSAYDRVTCEYPDDFRGWYNLARIFTNNFTSYSLFEEEKYGKVEENEFCENMLYAERTVPEEFERNISGIKNAYIENITDVSIESMKNTMYGFYTDRISSEKIAEYVRKYEDKLIYIYKKRPCVVTALSLHLLENILNNDNIKKYNERVAAHNRSLNSRVDRDVQDYVTELAQNLRIDNPKEYASNAKALEAVNTNAEYIDKIQNFRRKLESEQDYYSEIKSSVTYDVYAGNEFGAEREYKGYYPINQSEFDDEYVDFIIILANRCGIQMRGYEVFYTEEKRNTLAYIESVIEKASVLQSEYHKKYIEIRDKYSALAQTDSEMFSDITRALVNYEVAYAQYEKANSSSVFKQVFKGKETKETKEDTTAMFESAQAEVDSAAKMILLSARKQMAQLNDEFKTRYVDEAPYMAFYSESCLDDLIKERVTFMKLQREHA